MSHEKYMWRCLELASEGRGKVGNGALVGALLVRDGEILLEASYEGYGKKHAERVILESVLEKAKKSELQISPKDTLYVNLEPCCHHGKTPPCTDIIIDSGVKTVVYGILDPDSRMQGKGIEILRNAGINVIGPILESECRRLNKGFLMTREQDRPWVTVKMAFDKDGCTKCADGSVKKITSLEQDAWSHSFLRGGHDAILVGIETIITDNPQLTNRVDELYKKIDQNYEFSPYKSKKKPIVIVLDPTLRIPIDSQVLREGTMLIVSTECDNHEKEQILCTKGVRIQRFPTKDNQFDLKELLKTLATQADSFNGITSVLVEGGKITRKAFFDAGVVDEDIVLTEGV